MLFFFLPKEPPLSYLFSSVQKLHIHTSEWVHVLLLAVYAACVSVEICMRAAWARSRPERRAAASLASALGVAVCRASVESLPLSLRCGPLPPCLQICFTRCNKAFTQSLWCLCCFAAPLHCSPTVNTCCCVREYVQASDMYWFHFSCRRWRACSTKDIHVMW